MNCNPGAEVLEDWHGLYGFGLAAAAFATAIPDRRSRSAGGRIK